MILIDLVKTVYKDLKRQKIMSDKLRVDKEIRKLQNKKKSLQAEYDNLGS